MLHWIVSHPLIDQPLRWYYALIAIYMLALGFSLGALAVLVWRQRRMLRAIQRGLLPSRRRAPRVLFTLTRRDH